MEDELLEFKTEALEMLEIAERDLLALDRGEAFQPHYDSVFRVFHSLKGASGMLGLTQLQTHMHSLENILSECKTKKQIEPEKLTLFLSGVDAARKLIEGEEISFNFEVKSSTSNTPATTHVEQKSTALPKAALAQDQFPEGVAYLVDDEPDILEILSEILNSAGIETHVFTEPEKLIAAIKNKAPDLVISDMKMPGLSGMDVLKQVKTFNPDIPVMFISGYLDKPTLIKAINHGVHSTIEKPFNENSVTSLCLSAIRQSRLFKLFNRSINLILYQFSDLDDYLKQSNRSDVAKTMREELNAIIDQRRKYRELKKGTGA